MCVHEFEADRGKVEIKGGVPVRRFPSPSRSIHFTSLIPNVVSNERRLTNKKVLTVLCSVVK